MNKLIIWFIRHKITKLYFPEPDGRNGRGGSFTEANEPGQKARIFKTRLGAARFLGAWVRGEYHCGRGYDPGHSGNDWSGEYYEEVTIKPVPTRNKDDYEIICKEIIL